MDIVERLQLERQDLVDRLDKIDQMLGQYEEMQRQAESYLGPTHTVDTSGGRDTSAHKLAFGISHRRRPPPAPPITSDLPKTPMEEFARITLQILSDAAKPLNRTELYEKLLLQNVEIGSPDRDGDLNALSARMSRMANTVNVRGYGFWRKDREFIEGDYFPPSTQNKIEDDGEGRSLI